MRRQCLSLAIPDILLLISYIRVSAAASALLQCRVRIDEHLQARRVAIDGRVGHGFAQGNLRASRGWQPPPVGLRAPQLCGDEAHELGKPPATPPQRVVHGNSGNQVAPGRKCNKKRVS